MHAFPGRTQGTWRMSSRGGSSGDTTPSSNIQAATRQKHLDLASCTPKGSPKLSVRLFAGVSCPLELFSLSPSLSRKSHFFLEL